MAWKVVREGAKAIWQASRYDDLQYSEINNLAHYGQPNSPYQKGYDHNHIPDFENITIRMSQREVMFNGYGRLITPEHFPIVIRFLRGEISVIDGTYSFDDLVMKRLAKPRERFIFSNLYTRGSKVPVTSGMIKSGDAAYIHGSIGFALMKNTKFSKRGNAYTVSAELGALDDNWNFRSASKIAKLANPLVATLFGPDHNNLQPNLSKGETAGQIDIEFTGPGKKMLATRTVFPHHGRHQPSFPRMHGHP